jgi:hypothetical protein
MHTAMAHGMLVVMLVYTIQYCYMSVDNQILLPTSRRSSLPHLFSGITDA